MMDNIELPRIEKVVFPIYAAVPNTAIILYTMAMALGVYHTVLDLGNIFF